MGVTGDGLDRFRQPEYTGENRCMACTVVNTVIAILLAAAVTAGGWTLVTSQLGVIGGVIVLFGSLAMIYLRGYLVPGTPELTKRYFPDWLLAVFGKTPEGRTIETDLDPETALVTAGALEECADRDDLCLVDEFRRGWYEEIDQLEAEGTGREQLLDVLGLEEGEVSFEEHGEAFRATVDGQFVGRWESQAAFLADLGAARELEGRIENWDGLPVEARSQLLSGLRIFIDSCPSCGGTPDFGTDTVESCCSTHEVAAVSCGACGARLFESRV